MFDLSSDQSLSIEAMPGDCKAVELEFWLSLVSRLSLDRGYQEDWLARFREALDYSVAINLRSNQVGRLPLCNKAGPT